MRTVLCCCLTAGLIAADYEPPALGEALSAEARIPAGAGMPELRVVVHYPPGAGPWPVIVFSHGLGGSGDGYAFLGRHWAAHGYACLHPDHPGSDTDMVRRAAAGGVDGLQEALARAATDPAVAAGRPRHLARVLDRLDDIASQASALAGKLDATRIGVAGHSYGAWTALALAGLSSEGPGGQVLALADPRPRAFVALSPPGPSRSRPERAWSGIARPVLTMTGSRDEQPAFLRHVATGDTGTGGTWRAESFRCMPPGGKWLVWIEGATHATFSDGAGARLLGQDPRTDPRHLRAIRDTTLAFWDLHLREDARARDWLAGAGPRIPGLVRVERK